MGFIVLVSWQAITYQELKAIYFLANHFKKNVAVKKGYNGEP